MYAVVQMPLGIESKLLEGAVVAAAGCPGAEGGEAVRSRPPGQNWGKKKKESRLLEITFNTFYIVQRYKLTRITTSNNILLFAQYIQNYYMSVFKGEHAVLFLKQHRPVVGGGVHKLIVT